MTVLVTLRMEGSGQKLEEYNRANPATPQAVVAKALEHGVIHHRFWASETEILVVDEWPDEASFQAFFDGAPEVADIMAAAGVTGPPQISFWHPLDIDDAF